MESFDLAAGLRTMQALVPEFLEDLRALVAIDSGTHDTEGVDRVRELLAVAHAQLGATTEVVPASEVADHLLAEYAGPGTGRVLLLGHMDTVYPRGTAATRPFTVQNGRATGPGTADMKAGDLAIVYAMRLLGDQGAQPYERITVLHNSDEEIGSKYSRDLVRDLARKSDVTFVLEAGRESGDIVSGRKGIVACRLEVRGVAAHAGVNHARGRSAVVELCRMVADLERLNGTVPGATLNVGFVSGGGPVNVVPDRAEARFEVRAFSRDGVDRMVERVRQIVDHQTIADTSAQLEVSIDHDPMHRTERTGELVQLAQALASDLGFELSDTVTGGASDGNNAAAVGCPVLDGLGPVGGGAHSLKEYVDIESIAPRVTLLAGLIARHSSPASTNSVSTK